MQSIRIYEMPSCKMVPREKGCLEKKISRDLRNGSPHKIAAFFPKIFCIGLETDLFGCIYMKME